MDAREEKKIQQRYGFSWNDTDTQNCRNFWSLSISFGLVAKQLIQLGLLATRSAWLLSNSFSLRLQDS